MESKHGTSALDKSNLLTTAEMAQFVARGFVEFEAVVPEGINLAAIAEFERTGVADMARPKPKSGTPLADMYPDPSPIGQMLRLDRVQGIIQSLVGLDSVYDHDWVHVRESGDVLDQYLHQDAIVDVTRSFDIQLFWFPHDVVPGGGGTGFVPGSHLRHVNQADIARYQNLSGQCDFAGSAGSIVVFHHGMWHRGRANHSPTRRWMYKLRLNPQSPQVRRWNLDDYEAVEGEHSDHIFGTYDPRAVSSKFRKPEPWFEFAASRLETFNRSQLWRYLTGDDSFDSDWYHTRTETREAIDGGVR